MAKRRRLNKRVAFLLVVVGSVLTIALVVGILANPRRDPERYARRAEAHLAKGEYKQASDAYNTAVSACSETDRRIPQYMVAWGDVLDKWRLGDPSLKQNERWEKFSQARDLYRRALRYDPNLVDAHRRLLKMATLTRDTEQCIAVAAKLMELVPEDHDIRYQWNQQRARLVGSKPQSFDSVLEEFRKLVKLVPKEEKYWRTLAIFLRVHRRDKEAEQVYKKAIAEIPGSAKIRVDYAYLLQRLDRRDEALPILAEMIRLQPKEAAGYIALSQYHRKDGRIDEAVQALDNAIKVDPTDFRAYSSLAGIRVSEKAYDQAEAVLKKGLGALAKQAGENAAALEGEALEKYRQGVIRLNQQLCDVWLDGLQRRKLEGKEKEEVLKAVNQSLEAMRRVNMRSPYVEKLLGRLALVDNKYLEAERHLRIAHLSLQERGLPDPTTVRLLVRLYRRIGQPGNATNIVRRYLAASKDNAAGLAMLGGLYVDSRQYAPALDCIKESLELEPKNPPALALRAALEIATGQSDSLPADVEVLTPRAERLILERARQLWEESEPDRAIGLAAAVLTKNPRSLNAYRHLIVWYRKLDRPDDAKRVFQVAVKALADNPNAQRVLMMTIQTDRQKLLEMQLAMANEDKDPIRRHLRLAEIHHGHGNEEKYVEHLKEAEKIDPKADEVVRAMWHYCLDKGDLKSAEKYLTIAAAKDLDGAGGRYYQAQLAFAEKKWDEAARLAREALRVRPTFTDAHVLLGTCYRVMKRYTEAKQEYLKALEQNRSNFRALLGLIEVCRATGKTGEYNHYVETAYKQNPSHPTIRESYLQILEKQKRIEPAKLIRIREAILKDNPRDAQNLARLAQLYEQDDRLAGAEGIYRALAGRRGTTHVDVRRLVMFLRRTDRDQEARSILAKYVGDAKDKVGAYLLWSNYLEAAGELEQAEAAGLKAVQADVKGREACLSMGRFYSNRRNWDKAIEFQKKYLAAAGADAHPKAKIDLIRYLLAGGKTDEAAKPIQEALASNPKNALMLALKGRLMFKQNKHSQAEKLFNEAMTVDSQNVQALVYRADLHAARGHAGLEEADLKLARRIAPTRAIVFRLARLYNRQRDFVRAHTVLQSFLLDAPDDGMMQREIVLLCMRHQRWEQMRQNVLAAQKALPRDPFFFKREADMWLSQSRSDPGKAMVALDKANRLAPRDTETTLLMGQAMLLAGRPDDAIKLGESLRTHKGARPMALAMLARARLKRGETAAANKEFVTALKEAQSIMQLGFVIRQIALAHPADKGAAKLAGWASARPDDWYLPFRTGLAYCGTGNFKTALGFYERALGKASEPRQRESVLRELGMVYDQLGKQKQGLAAYREVLKISPNDGRTLNNLAWMLAKDPGKLDEAAKCAKRATELLPNSAEVLDTYGTVLLARKQYDQAREVLRRSTDKEKIPANLLHYGMALEKLGAEKEARNQYRQGWEMVKKNPRDLYYKDLKAAYERLSGAPAGRTTP